MRWHFLDRVIRFEAWKAIEGRKAVSLEEYSLLEPFGRKGCLPESLVIESCVHLARWLVVASSSFEQTCSLSAIERFEFERETVPGSALTLVLAVVGRQEGSIRLSCRVHAGGQPVGGGELTVATAPLRETATAEDMRTLWQELYGKA